MNMMATCLNDARSCCGIVNFIFILYPYAKKGKKKMDFFSIP